MTEQHKLLNTGEKTQGKTQKQKEIENIKLDQKILLNMDDAFATDYTMSFDSLRYLWLKIACINLLNLMNFMLIQWKWTC